MGKDNTDAQERTQDVGEPLDDVGEPLDDVGEPLDDVGEPLDDENEEVQDTKEASILKLETKDSWGDPTTLKDHVDQHGPDFDAVDEDDYAQKASEFFQRSQQEGLPSSIGDDGTLRTYDAATNTFGAYNPDGTTKTFFKPTSTTYWERQAAKGSPPIYFDQ